MTDFVRRLVSGDKARFKDEKLDLELDLVYITDRVIVMGYPASGLEGLYRNKREDAKRFLDTRHGDNYWVFNFCPVAENSYPSSVFEGRVSRYPFPDHHVPPLAILPLATREMHSYLDGSRDRVVVLHCKAGKGRSGTMACSYLMSTDDVIPAAKKKETEEWTEVEVEALMSAMPTDDPSVPLTQKAYESTHPTENNATSSGEGEGRRTASEILTNVLELHSSKRMKAPAPGGKGKQGVSIPSQRRWLHYWSLLLSHRAPPHFWVDKPHPKVLITSITLRMKEASTVKYQLIRATNAILDRTSEKKFKGKGEVWVSLARYDDELAELLESRECHTRDEGGHMELRSGSMGDDLLTDVFNSTKWDEKKMVRSFARMGMSASAQGEDTKDLGKVITYVTKPLTDEKWVKTKEAIASDDRELESLEIKSETTSVNDVTTEVFGEGAEGIVVDANRELRAKLYAGQIFMGWFWFIPAFHFAEGEGRKKWKLTRKELDFPLGVGSDIVDVEVEMERVDEALSEPPARVSSIESRAGKGEPSFNAVNVAHTLASGDVENALEARQAVET
ncbi:phosphatases II [Thelephora terrestris]|uniref:phosphatidylinositol-3,4,5-trisphosphate 3-phosphatase n=1 Tax=Thelephora terrestris TaxID=56493 RepID=A0A9P6LA74_9AGAM|nr:phosphatases II [Thelephora terrestris]